jgi:hypothetical protein
MRFRYIDDKGREIDLETVEALAARIQLGALREDMSLYDAAADRWAPASEHDIFQRLKTEGLGRPAAYAPLPAPSPPIMPPSGSEPHEPTSEEGVEPEPPGSVDSDVTDVDLIEGFEQHSEGAGGGTEVPDDPWTLDQENEPADPEAGAGEFEFTLLDTEVPEVVGFETGEFPLGEDEPEADGPEAGGSTEEIDLEPIPAEEETIGLEPSTGAAHIGDAWEALEEVSEEPAGNNGSEEGEDLFLNEGGKGQGKGSGTMPGWAEASPDLQGGDGDWESPMPPPVDALSGFRTETEARKAAARARAAERAPGDSGSSGTRRRVPGRLLAVAVVVAVVGGYAVLRQRAPAPSEEGTSTPGPESATVQEPSLGLTLAAFEAQALTEGVGSAMNEALRFMGIDPSGATEVEDRPPPEWLAGVYLANSSQFPQVRAYWMDYRDRSRNLAAGAERRFHETLLASLQESGIETVRSEAILDGADPLLEPLVRDLREIAEARVRLSDLALEFHEYLTQVEDRIRYDPFEGGGVPEDPVVEAVPLDEEVEREMWGRIGQVAEAREGEAEIVSEMAVRLEQIESDVRSLIR